MGRLCLAWIVFAGLYALFAGQISATECAAGVPAALLVALLSVWQSRVGSRRFAGRAPWPRVLAAPLASIPPDALRVGGVLLRAIAKRPGGAVGVVSRQPFEHGGDDPAAATRRALVTLGSSLAPNGYVLDIPDGENAVILHRLAPVPPSPDREWPL